MTSPPRPQFPTREEFRALTVEQIDALSRQLDAGAIRNCPEHGQDWREEFLAVARMARALAVLESDNDGGEWQFSDGACEVFIATCGRVHSAHGEGPTLLDAIEAAVKEVERAD